MASKSGKRSTGSRVYSGLGDIGRAQSTMSYYAAMLVAVFIVGGALWFVSMGADNPAMSSAQKVGIVAAACLFAAFIVMIATVDRKLTHQNKTYAAARGAEDVAYGIKNFFK